MSTTTEGTVIKDTQTDFSTVQYFAIGSMMNPVSCGARGLRILRSSPAIIKDYSTTNLPDDEVSLYRLGFYGKNGMAEALPSEGDSFHGVLHELHAEDLQVLDRVEFTYDRQNCTVLLYSGETVIATVYVLKAGLREQFLVNNLPSERYMELLIEGCRHHGVDNSHIQYLRSIAFTPRKKSEEFLKLSDFTDDLPEFTMEEAKRGNGRDGNPMYILVNGKVRQYMGDESHPLYNTLLNCAGNHLELAFSKFIYEPKYGMPKRIEDFTREHCAYIEDEHVSLIGQFSGHPVLKTIGMFQQTYAD